MSAEEQSGSVINCYNTGIVTETSKVGSISGVNGLNSSFIGATIENCYYLQGTNAVGVGRTYSYIKNETFSRSYEEMTNIATILGDSYKNDIQNADGTWKYNEGYPILKW